MPTLSSLFPFSRLAALRRAPFWAQAAAACALLAGVGVVVLDDYGMTYDSIYHRRTAVDVANYALGVSEEPPGNHMHDSYYGMAFQMPLLLVERLLGLQDSRHIYLTRHLLTHLFFIAGGFACAMLAYRMIGSRWIALLAMLMFLLHPRLYVHSFINGKDIPFAAMLVIALYLTHRAFRKDTLGAFLLCGVGVGLAINLRVFGLMLLPMILAMRALDLWQASGRAERKHILASAGMFAAAAIAIVYIIHPYYWENPLRFVDGARMLSQHPTIVENLFMGEIHLSDSVQWNYIPVWFAITAPPLTLLLGAIGCAAMCWQGVSRPIVALRDREIRFRILLLCCFALPVVAVIALQSNIYHGWRHMHFLWGPFCLMAAIGLHRVVNICMGVCTWKVVDWLPRWVRGAGRLHMAQRALAYSVVGAGLITTITAMAALHPYEYLYFNALVDTKTPGAPGNRYEMDYWRVAHSHLMEYLVARYPDDMLRVRAGKKNSRLLSQSDRNRVVIARARDHDADFYFDLRLHYWRDTPDPPAFHSIEAYGSDIAIILAPNSDAYLGHYRAKYDDVAANGTLLARTGFDIYAYDGAIYYLSADCPPLEPNHADFWIFLRVTPDNLADLPVNRREHGYENRDFKFSSRVDFFDGKCVVERELPGYAIERIHTGRLVSGEGQLWGADINLAARAAGQALYDRIAGDDYGAPVAQSDFDVYLRGNGLAYLKGKCAAGDADARFFLHIIPVDPADLPADSREHGFVNLDFQFTDHGAYIGDNCVATRELPNYPIDRIRTGQFVSGEGRVWGVEFPAAP